MEASIGKCDPLYRCLRYCLSDCCYNYVLSKGLWLLILHVVYVVYGLVIY